MQKEQLGRTVRRLRKERAWTQVQLSEIAGISTRTLQRLETRGMCAPESLMAVATAFDKDVSELTAVLFDSPEIEPVQLNLHVMELPDNPTFAKKTLVLGSSAYLAAVSLVVIIAVLFFPEPSYLIADGGSPDLAAVQYRKFIQMSAISLAIMLGFWGGFSGALKKSWFFGVLVLGLGVLVSICAFALLPWISYPNDRYSPGAVWIFVGLVPLVVSWALVNVGFRVLERWE